MLANRLKIKMLKPMRILILFTLGIIFLSEIYAQGNKLSEATGLSASGDYKAAEEIFREILSEDPENLDAMLGLGYNYSWQKQYETAKKVFAEVLRKDTENLNALSGMGYTLAWNEEYTRAEVFFNKILEINPGHTEGEKGLAYIALWEGNEAEAVRLFQQLLDKNPFVDEYILAIAQAYASMGKHRQARLYYDSTLEIAPHRKDITGFVNGVHESPAMIEGEVWGGYTNLQSTGKLGLRAAQLTWRPAKNYRLWGRFDNSLTLDNFSLVQNQRGAGTVYLGGVADWNSQLTTRLEVGRRFWDEGNDQMIYQAEQVVFTGNDLAIKVGGFIATGTNRFSEKMVFGGVNIPLNPRVSFEPVYFFASTSPNITEHRLMASAKSRLLNLVYLDAGIIYGTITGSSAPENGEIIGTNVVLRLPMGKYHWLQFLFRYEHQDTQSFTTAAVGLRLRLEN